MLHFLQLVTKRLCLLYLNYTQTLDSEVLNQNLPKYIIVSFIAIGFTSAGKNGHNK